MADQQKVTTNAARCRRSWGRLGGSRPCPEHLVHLACMTTSTRRHPSPAMSGSEAGLDPVLTLSALAAQLGVSVQTMYDLRSQGRGPRGFRVGRELRFRVSEIEAWLARLEEADALRHPEALS